MEFCTFEADSSNVLLSDWFRDRIGLKCTKFLTFDSNSTSGFEESDVLKIELMQVPWLKHIMCTELSLLRLNGIYVKTGHIQEMAANEVYTKMTM